MSSRIRISIAATATAAVLAGALLVTANARAGHGLDHNVPFAAPPDPPSANFNSGGRQATWDLVGTVATGNPHTDLDFFTRGNDTYASVGTLGNGVNAGGQTIVRLMNGNQVDPELVGAHPSASCVSDPSQALGLQHDVEATPKGGTLLNIKNKFADRNQAKLILDATDAPGRCHDQGMFGGLTEAPQGGLEIIDVTNPANPVEIGFTSHIGEAHTVNIDPKRPHIAYAVTSDAVTVNEDGSRANEDPASSLAQQLSLDGFEVVDFRSCLEVKASQSLASKREDCSPKVYRYRYPNTNMSLGHTLQTGTQAIYGCHELEVYPSDLLTCASGNALIGVDMSKAFKDRGTPKDFTDDKPKGKPLPCRRRDVTTAPTLTSGAMVVDCVDGTGSGETDLSVPEWLGSGAPSLRGVKWVGSIHHQGRGAGGTDPTFDSTEDIDFNHESELTASGRFLLATDERGGGVLPPGASCSPGVDNVTGNGGIHAYKLHKLKKKGPQTAQKSQKAYAKTFNGNRAIFRAEIRTGPQPTLCTAHVFQQIPKQNRIFMGWYSQGTRVIDFKEKRRKGKIKFSEAGFLIPENANSWVSHVFSKKRNRDGGFTYYGATGDFNLGSAGRSAIDVYRAKLPAPPKPKRPLARTCKRKRWQLIHQRNGKPFASKAACKKAAAKGAKKKGKKN